MKKYFYSIIMIVALFLLYIFLYEEVEKKLFLNSYFVLENEFYNQKKLTSMYLDREWQTLIKEYIYIYNDSIILIETYADERGFFLPFKYYLDLKIGHFIQFKFSKLRNDTIFSFNANKGFSYYHIFKRSEDTTLYKFRDENSLF